MTVRCTKIQLFLESLSVGLLFLSLKHRSPDMVYTLYIICGVNSAEQWANPYGVWKNMAVDVARKGTPLLAERLTIIGRKAVDVSRYATQEYNTMAVSTLRFALKTLLHKSTEASNTDVACLRLYCLVPLQGRGFVGYFRSFLPLTILMPFCAFCMRWPLRL